MAKTYVATAAALADKQATSEKGQVNGYAGLDGSGKVPSAQLPSGTTTLYIQQTQPSSPPTGSLWIPLNVDGSPKSIDQWQVFS